MITISRKDVIWGYFAQFFSVASGLITLPLILNMLSAEEIGMNYLLLSLGALVSLLDFGFTPQFSRNITYIFSGAQELRKEGVAVIKDNVINFRLLATMIFTAKFVYQKLAIIVLAVMLSLGTIYIYNVTKGFTNIDNSLFIWVLYSVSVFFNIYYSYYTSLLIGKGLIMESKKALVYSKSVYIVLTFILLFSGLGLLAVVIANLVAPFVSAYISYRFFFTKELVDKISVFTISRTEKNELFEIIWFNAKKLGLVFIGAYSINKLSIFLAGLYLSLSDIASYGLMIQVFGLLTMMASMFFSVLQPRFSSLRTLGRRDLLLKEFAFSMNLFFVIYMVGAIFLLTLAPYLLALIGSNTVFPSNKIMWLFAAIILLETNHSNFASLIVTNNTVPFVIPSLIAGFFIGLGSYISLSQTEYGILGLVLVQGIVQLAYANWKWPRVVCNEFGISFNSFFILGFRESVFKVKSILFYGR
jgi:O-antigen/teichoic acid export membrane protein